MTYVQGFLLPVPNANKEKFIAHASEGASMFTDLGATRLIESWGDDVPDGTTNDLKKAVNLKDDETVLFSWIEWPDKATHDAANTKMMEDNGDMEGVEMPFDGMRMMWGGFQPILETGTGKGDYVDGFLIAVPEANKQAYRDQAEKAATVFKDYGAVRVVETWEDNVEDGKVTDFNRATMKEAGEKVVYSWVEWPDKATRDAAWPKVMEDERLKGSEMPFDGKRMMWGGFQPVVDVAG